jgi:hypothetical protein
VVVSAVLDPVLDPLEPLEVPVVLDAVPDVAVVDGVTLVDSRIN